MLKKRAIFIILLLVILAFDLIPLSLSVESPKASDSTPMQPININGIIDETEWAGADWKVPIFLDIDDVGNPPDTDGFNYLYLGEDLSNVYVGLDLCSDQTDDTTGEWVGVWLNTINRTFLGYDEWENYLDDGTESLVYDVESQEEWIFLSNTIAGILSRVNDASEYSATYGTISGGVAEMDNLNMVYFNVTAELVNGYYVNWVEFEVDTTKWFWVFKDIFAASTQWLDFQIYAGANESILEHYIYLYYGDGTLDPSDPYQVKELNNAPIIAETRFEYGAANFTADHKLKFVLYANSSSPFTSHIDSLHLTPYYNMTNSVATVSYPYTSINSYQIEWSFGPSFNNASDHRMFEIKIPKSELEHYDPGHHLGIIVGGYGTMSFVGSNYWVFSATDINIQEQFSDSYLYYFMFGCVAPSDFPLIPGYNLYLILVLLGATMVLLINKKKMLK